jgi:aminoglycoside phosphotransferase (APT) family kinase protein
MPKAELSVSLELVRQLLTEQHSDLAHLPLSVMANGWDNVIVRAGDDLVVRLPRRAAAAGLIANEQRWLPVLAPRLPLPIPAPVRVGTPGAGYPWPWSVSAFIPGKTAAETPPSDDETAAESLALFLAALHTTAPPNAPVNPVRGIPLAEREPSFTRNLTLLDGRVDRPAIARMWAATLETPLWSGQSVWLHGDLHPANIIVHDGRISAVIDFGDITAGDPATDLAAAWMLLPSDCHERFWAVYARDADHGADSDLQTRSKGWALALSLAFLAHSADNPLIARIGRRTLDAVLTQRIAKKRN